MIATSDWFWSRQWWSRCCRWAGSWSSAAAGARCGCSSRWRWPPPPCPCPGTSQRQEDLAPVPWGTASPGTDLIWKMNNSDNVTIFWPLWRLMAALAVRPIPRLSVRGAWSLPTSAILEFFLVRNPLDNWLCCLSVKVFCGWRQIQKNAVLQDPSYCITSDWVQGGEFTTHALMASASGGRHSCIRSDKGWIQILQVVPEYMSLYDFWYFGGFNPINKTKYFVLRLYDWVCAALRMLRML